ncbi:truncated hemoglobin [Streptomyces sp. NPDC004284]|uniref:truncated hemoglobin n=1 Tax=Streptomyces sp. NPDC004284 TaxID=3364695 RepID=UPI00367E2DE9
MSPDTATPAPRHDGKVLLVADQGLQSGEQLSAAQVDRKVSDFWTGIGGAAFFEALTTRFYELVADDELLSPLFAVPDWPRHAARLGEHFRRIYGENDLTAAWDPKMHQAHAHFLISREQRMRWLALMKQAGTQLQAPEPHFTEFLTIMKIASGEMTAVSRGAALARGERFHWDGSPA